jgi:predicted ABC-type ATPase
LSIRGSAINSYVASVVVEFLRHKLIRQETSFTFETVMSHRSKVDFLASAQAAGFRTYLYYIATDDPAINVARVRNRASLGGHDVPEDRILSRYYKSMELLTAAIRNSNRAFIFDNSFPEHSWIAEITDGKVLELKMDRVPEWFKVYVLDKFKPTN